LVQIYSYLDNFDLTNLLLEYSEIPGQIISDFITLFILFSKFYFISIPDLFYVNTAFQQINYDFKHLLKPIISFHNKIYPIIPNEPIVIQNIYNLFYNGFFQISFLIYNNYENLLEEFKQKKILNYNIIENLVNFVQCLINISNEHDFIYLNFSKDQKIKIKVNFDYIFQTSLQSLDYFSGSFLLNLT
jgi:hypothetical protein